MTAAKVLVGAACFLSLGMLLTTSVPLAQTPPPGAPPTARGGAGGPAGPGQGRGRGGAAATLYNEQCAGCHGVDLQGNRAPSLFDQAWLNTVDDARLMRAIRNGVPDSEMAGFAPPLTDDQIWSLTQYIRTQGANLRTRPPYVANPDGAVIASEKAKFKLEVVTSGLDTPWGLAFLPDGRMLVTERSGQLRVVTNGKASDPVKGTKPVHVQQDAGMFDVAVDPNYTQNGWVYLSYAEVQPGFVAPPAPPAPPTPDPAQAGRGRGRGGAPQPPSLTVFVRGRINANNEWVDEQVLYRAPLELYTNRGDHYGTRFIFDREGHLFFSIGERGVYANAQDLTNPLGKVHRINTDGSVPADNPFVGRAGAVPSIWAYGNRNPQGFSWDPRTGLLWESEHGPQAGDEINIIEKGHNYGWGLATMGTQPGITQREAPGTDPPIVYYIPTLAPSGITFYTGDAFPAWRNNLFVGGLAGQQLRRLEIDGRTVTHQEVLFEQFGRVRTVINGPDGLLYALIQNRPTSGSVVAPAPGAIVRIRPAQ